MRIAATVGAVVALAAVPATADAATYLNNTPGGAYAITSGRSVEHLEVYCTGQGLFDRELAFSMADRIVAGRSGRFAYSGKAFEYGPERQPRGEYRVKLSGRLSSGTMRVTWSLPGCGSGTTSAARQR